MGIKLRTAWLWLHRWTGLVLATVWVLVGLSGSYLAFGPEIDRMLNPDWATPQSAGPARPLAEVLAAAQAAEPHRFVHSVFPASGPQDVHHVWLTPSASDDSRMWELLVDPASARVLGQREAVPTADFGRRNLGNAVYTLHMQLLLGERGRVLVGLSGLFLLASAITGLVLWWPRSRAGLRQALRIKPGARGLRLHFDLHRSAGFYASLLLAMLGLTGAAMTFPGEARSVLNASGATMSPRPRWSEPLAPPHLDGDAAVATALRHAPGARLLCLWLPGASGPHWRVSLGEPGRVGAAEGRSEVWVDRQSGALLVDRRFERNLPGDTVFDWLLPLHNGQVLGLAGRVLIAAAGLLPLLLAVTGTVIWLRKRRGRLAAVRRKPLRRQATRPA
ncbi:MAG: hypothetical protein EKK52_14935 [Burkholderiales bacterium]|uniref:PepSY-associated TM helix domain-containing protein n=1 Tax=Roseateles sp. TaxID=1971397 RepID=UPI000FA1B7DD|nr:MAG: hypothetical protein EKK52_14935 [Burkholderiales bacterium]